MFEKIKEDFYKSLAKSIKDRKDYLKLKRRFILTDPTRVSKITSATRNEHHPYLIGKKEYAYLYCLYLFDNDKSFLKEKTAFSSEDELIKKNGDNYDKMLWGHINWDKMFKDVITELSELDLSNSLGTLFEDTLTDYVPYAIIQYEKLHTDYAKVYIFPEDREKSRQDAIQWVHLRYGSVFFKKTFLEKFKGTTLKEFDNNFNKFVEDYLKGKKPTPYSLGLQARNLHINISGFSAYWQSRAESQYSNMYDKKSDLEKTITEYINNGQKQIYKLIKYQQDFDSFNIDIK